MECFKELGERETGSHLHLPQLFERLAPLHFWALAQLLVLQHPPLVRLAPSAFSSMGMRGHSGGFGVVPTTALATDRFMVSKVMMVCLSKQGNGLMPGSLGMCNTEMGRLAAPWGLAVVFELFELVALQI